MRNFLKPVIFSLGLFVCVCCGGGSDGGGVTPPPGGDDDDPVAILDPTAATLVFPDDDTECNEGEIISNTESRVTFQWTESDNTDSYILTLTNLSTGVSTNTNAGTNESSITLLRGTPYEWYVTSRSNTSTVTAKSETWRFYNEGEGIGNYAPFPAEAIYPERGATLPASTTSISLEWSASDIDNDIVEYEVFFGLESGTLESIGNITDSTIGVNVESGNIYSWYIKTLDGNNNVSISETFQFMVSD